MCTVVTCVCAVVTSQARSGNRFYNKIASGKNKRAGSGKPYTKFNGSRFKQTGTDNSLLLIRLLVLGNEVVHVGRSLGVTGAPVEEGHAAEQAGELLADSLGHFLDGGGVAEEVDGHLVALGGCHSRRT